MIEKTHVRKDTVERSGMALTASVAKTARRGVAKSRGGRPTKSAAAQRDQRLIEVARRLFLERGFEATSIDAVAEAARVSKPTVYARYRDKRGLFEAVLRGEISRWLAPLAAAAESEFRCPSNAPVEQLLVDLGRQLHAVCIEPNTGAVGRIVAAQATNFPDLARLAEEEGWSKAVATMARVFDRLVAEGILEIPDTTAAADMFLNIVAGHTFRLAIHGIPIDLKAHEKRLRSAVKLLLTGLRGPQPAAKGAKGTSRR